MASMYYDKKTKRWRVAWRVKLPDGSMDSGSKTFGGDKTTALKFKEHCEKQAELLKRTVFVNPVYLSEATQEWETYCLRHTVQTRKHYIREIEKFIEFLPDTVIYITDLSKFHINSYLNGMMSRGLANKTVNNSLCSIKSLCGYISENFSIANPSAGIKKLKEDPADPNFWTEEEYNRIIGNSDDRTKTWIRFIACTGLRATEFCNLQFKNCNFNRKSVTIVGKGRKKRTIGLNNTALEILKQMKHSRVVKASDYIFVRENGEQLSRDILGWYIRKSCCNAGLASGGPHAARHFFATQLLLAGVPIIKVSALLGHSSISTTQRHYSHILTPDLSDITNVLKAI